LKRILIVDDEQSMRDFLAILLKKEGLEVLTAGNRAEAADALRRSAVDMVLTDVRLPDGDGLEILRHVKAASPETAVIVMTAYGTAETAVLARKLGAEAYVLKPFDVDEVRIVIRDALATRDLREENVRLRREMKERFGLGNLVGVSTAMASLFEMVRAIAPATSTVLITGRAAPARSSWRGRSTLSRPLGRAALRGRQLRGPPRHAPRERALRPHEGRLHGRARTKKGLFEAAHGGTLFLDEVGETSPAMQVKLLRALQDRRIRRVGGNDEMEVDVRVIAATNAPLETLVREKRFREDLFYRLQVFPVHAPPLRERREDIPVLAEHFLERFAREMGKRVVKVSDEAMDVLKRHSWPGNVRELENVIERAVALETTEAVLPERLPEGLPRRVSRSSSC
jgi:two-component system, NtrC family, response regulator PilR